MSRAFCSAVTNSDFQSRLAVLEGAGSSENKTLVDCPVTFIKQAIGMILDPWQRVVIESEEKRILMLCARQVGKSQTAANLCAYRAVAQPGINILLISPSLRQSRLLFDKVESVLLKSKEPKITFDIHTRTHLQLSNGSTIHALPGTNADMVRGYTSDLVVVDEACFIKDAIFTTVLPMLGTTDGTLILLSTPSGPESVFYDSWQDTAGNWEKIKVFASDCPRISKTFLEEAEKKLGDYRYRQEYGLEFLTGAFSFFNPEALDLAFAAGQDLLDEEQEFITDEQTIESPPTIVKQDKFYTGFTIS